MRILFLVLVGLFQMLGALQPVQSLVSMVMSTGLVKDPQAVFICLALSIIVFAALVKFVPSFAGPFQKVEDWLKGIKDNVTGASNANALATQMQSITADVEMLKSLVIPPQNASPASTSLDALATGQPAAAPASPGAPQ